MDQILSFFFLIKSRNKKLLLHILKNGVNNGRNKTYFLKSRKDISVRSFCYVFLMTSTLLHMETNLIFVSKEFCFSKTELVINISSAKFPAQKRNFFNWNILRNRQSNLLIFFLLVISNNHYSHLSKETPSPVRQL